MWNGFWRYRYLLWNLVSCDFKLKYRRSVLGVVWRAVGVNGERYAHLPGSHRQSLCRE